MQSNKRPRSSSIDDDVQTSYKRLRAIKCSELAIEKKVESIQEKIEKLCKKRDQYVKKVETLKAGPFEQAIVPYAQSSTLALVAQMRTTLPRELRDIVYEFLWWNETGDLRFWTLQNILFAPDCIEKPCQCLRNRKIPTFVNPAFVGPEIALEAVESFYKVFVGLPGFPMALVRCLENIKSLVCNDVFHVGLDPATVLREARLEIHVEDYVTLGPPYTHQDSLKEYFEPLLRVVKKSGFQLKINLTQRHIRLNVLAEFLPVLQPIKQAFDAEGAHVTIKFQYDGDADVQWNLNEAVAAPSGNWKEDLIDYLESEPDFPGHHRDYLDENNSDYDPDEYCGSSDDPDEDDSEVGWDSEFADFCPCGCGRMLDEDDLDVYF